MLQGTNNLPLQRPATVPTLRLNPSVRTRLSPSLLIQNQPPRVGPSPPTQRVTSHAYSSPFCLRKRTSLFSFHNVSFFPSTSVASPFPPENDKRGTIPAGPFHQASLSMNNQRGRDSFGPPLSPLQVPLGGPNPFLTQDAFC